MIQLQPGEIPLSCFLCWFFWLHSYCQQIGMCRNLWNLDANCSEHTKQHLPCPAAGWCRWSWIWHLMVKQANLKHMSLFKTAPLLKHVVFNSNLDPVSFLTSYHVHILSRLLYGQRDVYNLRIIWTSAFQSVVVAVWRYIQHCQHWSFPFPLVWTLTLQSNSSF